MSRTPRRVIRAALAAATAVLLAAPAAQATFPGSNGLLTFTSYRNGTPGVWTMKPDGSAAKLVSAGWSSNPVWAPHGGQIAFERDGRIALVDAGGGDVFFLTPAGTWSSSPAWSPDGLRLVFARHGHSGYGGADLWTVNVDGTGLSRLTDTPGLNESNPDWSPDGRRIAFAASGFSSDAYYWSNDIHTMAADGSDRRNVTHGGYNDSPSWSPDGKQLAFSSQNTISVTNADGSGWRDLGYSGMSPVWSPDGEHIAFARHAPYPVSTNVIALVDDVTGALTNLSSEAHYDTAPDWQALPAGYPDLGPDTGTDDEVDVPGPPQVGPPVVPVPPIGNGNGKQPPVNVHAALTAYLDQILSGARGPLVRIGIQGLTKTWYFEPLVPAPGDVTVEITEDPVRATAAAAKPKVIARGKATAKEAGRLRVSVRPTKAGRKALRKAKKMRVRVKLSYAAKGLPKASSTARVTLKRR